MSFWIKSRVRTVQAALPGIWSHKHTLYNAATKYFGLMMDEEFKLLSRLGKIRLAIDIGGNLGQSIYAIKRCSNPEKIVSFEPIHELCQKMTADFFDDKSVEIKNVALSSQKTSISIFVPKYGYATMTGLASLEREAVTSWFENFFWRYDPKKLTIIENKVMVETLDSYNFEPDVVKIDVQGLEQSVVEGGIETLRTWQPLTIVEAPSDSLVKIFNDIGMFPFAFNNGKLSPNWREMPNVVFLSDRMRARLQL
jgi:FkbM family methyltransferase